MAYTSVRNLVSHIVAIDYSNFVSAQEKWIIPKSFLKGCTKMIDIFKDLAGAHFKPVSPTYILNEYCSSQYYRSGHIKGNSTNNG